MSENKGDTRPPSRVYPVRPAISPDRLGRPLETSKTPPPRRIYSSPPSRHVPPSKVIPSIRSTTPEASQLNIVRPVVPMQPRVNDYSRSERTFSRRKVLGFAKTAGALAVADSLLSHLPSVAMTRLGFTRTLWEQLESGTINENPDYLAELIEKEFGVELLSPNKGVTQVKGGEIGQVDTVEWDAPRLQALAVTLKDLPPNYYAPREKNGKKIPLKIALYEKPFIQNVLGGAVISECSNCQADSDNPTLVLQKDALGKTVLDRDARQTIVHEFTHYVTGKDILEYINTILKPIGIANTDDLWENFASEIYVEKEIRGYATFWEDKGKYKKTLESMASDEQPVFINEVVGISPKLIRLKGKDYFVKNPPVKEDVVESWRKQGKVYILTEPLYRIKKVEEKSHLGYGARMPEEFFSVAAEYYYLGGKTHFIDTYRPFLGEEKAKLLYEGMKREIFSGREY